MISKGWTQAFWRAVTFLMVFFIPMGIFWTLIYAYTGFVIIWQDYFVLLCGAPLVWLIISMLISSRVYVVPDIERWIVFRNGIGRRKSYGPGLILLIPFIDEIAFKIDRRERTMDIKFNQIALEASSGEGRVICNPELKLFINLIPGREYLTALEIQSLEQQVKSQVEGSILRVATKFNIDDALSEASTIVHSIAEDANTYIKSWGAFIRAELTDWDFEQRLKDAWSDSEIAETQAKAQLAIAKMTREKAVEYRQGAREMFGESASDEEIGKAALKLAHDDVTRSLASGSGVVPFLNVDSRKQVNQ